LADAPLRDMMSSLRASPVFALYVLATLGLAGVIGLMVLLMQLQPGFLGMGHFRDPSHRTHELTYSFLFGVAIVGILAQLRLPSKNVAAMLMALVPWVGLLLAAVLSADAGVILSTERMLVAVGTVMAAVLHPAGRTYLQSFSVSRVNRLMLALVIIAAVPLLLFAFTNIELQRSLLDDHAAQAHYGFMAAFGFTVIVLGVLASLRPDGWWLAAWVAGVLPVLLGLTSLVYPDNSSSLDAAWALAAIAWGIVFVGAVELTQDADSPTLLGSRGVISPLRASPRLTRGDDSRERLDHGPASTTPRWLNALGIIALVPIVLFFTLPLLGGGPAGGHAPGQGGPGQSPSPSGATSAGVDHEANTPPIDGAPELPISADNFAFSPARIELTTGRPVVNVALSSADIPHDLTVDEIGFHLAAEPAEPGETAIGGLAGWAFGEPGTYVGYCSVPGHREAGMELEIVVAPPDGFQH
jgi:plastocyanin